MEQLTLRDDDGRRTMADLISRAAAIKCAIDAVDDWDGGWNPNRETVIRKYFEELPAVDAVPVVRCKYCKYRHDPLRCQMDSEGMSTPDDWYCADGERRDDDADN